jgi:hypothetical protein
VKGKGLQNLYTSVRFRPAPPVVASHGTCQGCSWQTRLRALDRTLMFRWFSHTSKQSGPSYSLLRAVPSRGLPQDLADQEASPDYHEWRDRIECDLVAQACDEDEPNFVTFLKSGDGLLQLRVPQLEGGCLLAFSTPLRAADYASVSAPEQTFEYFCSSAKQVVYVVKEFREHGGISHVALDRCPRCNVFTTTKASEFDNAATVIQMWKIWKATETARSGLYWDYARSAARNGQFLRARDVALELVGHVTAEDPRSHLLLGKLAIQLHDNRLLREAKEFLAVLKQDWAIEELQNAEKTRVLEF